VLSSIDLVGRLVTYLLTYLLSSLCLNILHACTALIDSSDVSFVFWHGTPCSLVGLEETPGLHLHVGTSEPLCEIVHYLRKLVLYPSCNQVLHLKNVALWDVVPCGIFINRLFGGTCRLHLQSGRNNPSEDKLDGC
jgi:hypothetical protein